MWQTLIEWYLKFNHDYMNYLSFTSYLLPNFSTQNRKGQSSLDLDISSSSICNTEVIPIQIIRDNPFTSTCIQIHIQPLFCEIFWILIKLSKILHLFVMGFAILYVINSMKITSYLDWIWPWQRLLPFCRFLIRLELLTWFIILVLL